MLWQLTCTPRMYTGLMWAYSMIPGQLPVSGITVAEWIFSCPWPMPLRNIAFRTSSKVCFISHLWPLTCKTHPYSTCISMYMCEINHVPVPDLDQFFSCVAETFSVFTTYAVWVRRGWSSDSLSYSSDQCLQDDLSCWYFIAHRTCRHNKIR